MADDSCSRPGYSRSAFESELLSLSDRLLSFAHKLTRSKTAAEDLLQTTFLLALSKAPHYDPSQKLISWLGTLMHNAHVSIVRKEKPWLTDTIGNPVFFDRHMPTEEFRDTAPDIKIQFLRVAPSVLALPERQRDAVIGQHYVGMSHYEMREIFSCPLGTVKSLIREGMKKVREGVEEARETRIDSTAIERGLREVDKNHPYYPITEAVRIICSVVRTHNGY